MDYIANSEQDFQDMLSSMGLQSFEELLEDLPQSFRGIKYKIPSGLNEPEILSLFSYFSLKNNNVEEFDSFLGAGSYYHYIPTIVSDLISRGDFATAYTPYQPEASQGTLQSIFEFQSLIARLTGMDVANASLYEGASSMSEAAFMAIRVHRKSSRILVLDSVHPEYRAVLETYMKHTGEVCGIGGQTQESDMDQLESELKKGAAGLIVQYPNFFGEVEDIKKIEMLVHKYQALLIMVVNPIALGLLKTPGEWGADICVGEGQSLGNPMSYGGPYFGFIACRKSMVRKIPGRIVGMTEDREGNRGYVLTLQAREQHIRREKATSNICTNQALNALAGAIYLTTLGESGFKKLADLNFKKAHYMASHVNQLEGCRVLTDRPFFNEFVIKTSVNAEVLFEKMLNHKIFAGLPLSRYFEGLNDALLVCVTEMMSKESIDRYIQLLEKELSTHIVKLSR